IGNETSAASRPVAARAENDVIWAPTLQELVLNIRRGADKLIIAAIAAVNGPLTPMDLSNAVGARCRALRRICFSDISNREKYTGKCNFGPALPHRKCQLHMEKYIEDS